MRDERGRDTLRKLDFNSEHSGDPIARAYFRAAAIAIRELEGAANHWRRVASVERAKASRAETDARSLERKLSELAPDISTPTLQEGE